MKSVRPGYVVIFTPYITRNGCHTYASQFKAREDLNLELVKKE